MSIHQDRLKKLKPLSLQRGRGPYTIIQYSNMEYSEREGLSFNSSPRLESLSKIQSHPTPWITKLGDPYRRQLMIHLGWKQPVHVILFLKMWTQRHLWIHISSQSEHLMLNFYRSHLESCSRRWSMCLRLITTKPCNKYQKSKNKYQYRAFTRLPLLTFLP